MRRHPAGPAIKIIHRTGAAGVDEFGEHVSSARSTGLTARSSLTTRRCGLRRRARKDSATGASIHP